MIRVSPAIRPPLDPEFVPAALWNRCYREKVKKSREGRPLTLALERSNNSVSVFQTRIFRHDGEWIPLNERYVERLVKFLLWQKGGFKVTIAGDRKIAACLQDIYRPGGKRAFDCEFTGHRVYGKTFRIEHVDDRQAPRELEPIRRLGRHFEGCRVGFDLGGSDRKSAAVIDGEVVHTEEVTWDPYFATDPQYHHDGIHDCIRRAAAHLPRVDAIGGSAAGVYVDNEVRVASIFRGIPEDLFNRRIRGVFRELQRAWGGVPFVVVNDGEVTALAGSMSLNDNAVLGVAMGTSLAAGYVTSQGGLTDWLNELAFVPVDYRVDAPRDEWSGDRGVGAQYFSQQAVARLAPAAGIRFPEDMPLPERLFGVQELMDKEDERAARIYQTIGVYFGYNLAHYAEHYELRNVLVLGRVMSGAGGEVILSTAKKVLKKEFPELEQTVRVITPGESEKRLGQAVAAASLPALD